MFESFKDWIMKKETIKADVKVKSKVKKTQLEVPKPQLEIKKTHDTDVLWKGKMFLAGTELPEEVYKFVTRGN